MAAVESRMARDFEDGAVARAIKAHDPEADPRDWRPPVDGRTQTFSVEQLSVVEPTLSAMSADYPARASLRALLLEGAAAARRNPGVRASLRKEQLGHLEWWIRVYQSWQQRLDVDPEVDVDTLLRFLWAAELGLGVLEAYGITPPKPKAWQGIIERLMRAMHK